MDIWELAKIKLAEKEKKKEETGVDIDKGDEKGGKEETTVIVCGGRGCGKSSMILRFLDKNESSRPTTALEYVYARRMRGNAKQLCHLWELGGGTRLSNLLSLPLTKKNICSTGLIVVVDLTKTHEIRTTIEGLLPIARREAERALKEVNGERPHEYDILKEEMKERLNANKEQQFCSPFPIPLAIIGSKYDEFQNRESEERRKVCKLLRFVAHYYGAVVAFHSSRMETTLAKGRLVFAHMAFGAQIGRTSQTDINKALFIPCGMDSFTDIGPPPASDSSYSSLKASQPIDLWWTVFSESFPSTESKMEKVVDPSLDILFSEPTLDSFIVQKKRDLDMYAKQKKERLAAEERATQKIKNPN